MNGRVGVRIGSLMAAAACALLVACGGGGGGGGGITPSSATPTPLPTTSTSSSASGVASATASTGLVFPGTVGTGSTAISSGSVTIPQVSNGAGATIAGIMTVAAPSSASAPQARMVRARNGTALGIASTLAYFQLTFNLGVTIGTSPTIAATFAGALNPSDNYYLLFYDPTSTIATGWTSLGAATISNGNTLTFGPATLASAITLQKKQPYYFAFASTGTNSIQTPAPSASITPGVDATLPPITAIAGGRGGWTPYQVATALQMPVIDKYNGAGQTIVVVGDATPNPPDVSTYLTAVGLSSRPGGAMQIVKVAGGANGAGGMNGDDGEATLDVETVMGLAPGAKVEFYSMPDLSETSFLAAEEQIFVDPNTPKVMSISFGGCEDPNTVMQDDANFKQGVTTLGVAYTASSGDQGNECYNGGTPQYAVGANSPASDPYVIGVGGNENVNAAQTANDSLTSTAVWNDGYLSGAGAGGGGVSGSFPIPSYQSGLAGVASTSSRNVPDISMPSEGVAIYQAGWQIFGGTSWSAPEAAALIAQLNEYCGGTPANSVATWYTAFARSKGAAFIDVISGNNQFGGTTPYYRAAAGYDNASGLGLPLGDQVAANMCRSRTWAARVAAQSMMVGRESYAQAVDTDLHNAVGVRAFGDLGARSVVENTDVTLVLRDTATVAQDMQTVTAALRSAGFTVAPLVNGGTLLRASAPAAVVNAYFHTALHDVSQGSYGVRYANISSTTVPAAIAPYVRGVVANNLILRHRMSHRIY